MISGLRPPARDDEEKDRPPLAHTLVAFNTATASENKMHDDEVAGRFGFTSGLVPGVDVFGYRPSAARPVGPRLVDGRGMHTRVS